MAVIHNKGDTYFYNPDASINTHDILRPIPTQQINLTTVNGAAMTETEKKAYQNPGY